MTPCCGIEDLVASAFGEGMKNPRGRPCGGRSGQCMEGSYYQPPQEQDVMARDGAPGKARGWGSRTAEQQDQGASKDWGAPRPSRQRAALTEPSRAAHGTHESLACAENMHSSANATAPPQQQHTADHFHPDIVPHGPCDSPSHPLLPRVAATACGTPVAASQAHRRWCPSRGPGHSTSLLVQPALPTQPAAYLPCEVQGQRKGTVLSKRVASLQADLDNSRKAEKEARQLADARLQEAAVQVTSLQAELADTMKALRASRSTVERLGRAQRELQQRVDEAEAEMELARERNSETEYERTCLEVELQQLREELAQEQPRSHHLQAHGQHPGQSGHSSYHGHHAPLPPVLPLSGRRLLPEADHEVGFGADEVRHALYDMGEELKRQAKQLLQSIRGLRDKAWGCTLRLLPPGSQLSELDACTADLPARYLAAWLATRLQPAWGDPLSYILPEGGGLMGLPYGGDGGGLDEHEANTLHLLYGHAARRWWDVVKEAAEGVRAGAAGAGAGSWTLPTHSPAHKAVWEATESLAAGVARRLADELRDPNPAQHQSPQLVDTLRHLALQALRLGLMVRASHPLLRVFITPLPHPGQGQGQQEQAQRGQGQGQQEQVHAGTSYQFREDRHVDVRRVRVMSQSPPPQPAQPCGGLWQMYHLPPPPQQVAVGRGGSATGQPHVLFSVRPGACYVPAADYVAGGNCSTQRQAGPQRLVQEDVVTWVWVRPLQGAPGNTHLNQGEGATGQVCGSPSWSLRSAPAGGGSSRGAPLGGSVPGQPVVAADPCGRVLGDAVGPPAAPATPPREPLVEDWMETGDAESPLESSHAAQANRLCW